MAPDTLGPGDRSLPDKFEIVITRSASQPSHQDAETCAGVLIDGYQISHLTAEQFRRGHGAHLKPQAADAILRLADADEVIYLGL